MSGREAVEQAVEEVFAVADAFSADLHDALGEGTVWGEAGPETASILRDRDPGSYIGNQPWNGVRGDPINGTHNGKLDAAARARRAIKNHRHSKGRSSKNGATHL